MSIRVSNNTFVLQTEHTSYAFALYDGKYPVHLYYGGKQDCTTLTIPNRYNAFSPYYKEYGMVYSPDCAWTELPLFGNGDFRATALKLRGADGSCVTDFVYDGYEILTGRICPEGLPCADPDQNTQTLALRMLDSVTGCLLIAYYTVFADCDIITRYFRLENAGTASVKIERAMSATLNIPPVDADYVILRGAYPRERYYQREHVAYGMQSICSRRGASSHQFNPFAAVCTHDADEDTGEVYGINFVYSGSYLTEIEKDQNGMIRLQTGLGEENFGYLLERGQTFDCPEAVFTYSADGLNGMSHNFHSFIRAHILPPEPFPTRPIVLNTWEASYFDIDENNLLRFADAAKENGIDMLVMDDGWFGKRDDDTSSLGDWYEHKTKFPTGLASFVDRVKAKGIKFGIWIEPEMVNPDSDLYRAHPDWALAAPGREPLLSRHQMVLDFANPAVIDYLESLFDKTLGALDIDYIKWDMNRNISAAYSPYLPPERQDETQFRYMKGVYRLFRWFGERFPKVMIENCSGGGGRYDLGMMKYSTQIWTSDITDPGLRIPIQHGSTYAYPPCVMSCHVSNSGNLTADPRRLDFAFRTAINGMLGYELHLPDMPDQVKATVREQTALYRTYEEIIKKGRFYRVHNPQTGPYYSYYFVSEDESRILATFLQHKAQEREDVRMAFRADPMARYTDELTGKEYAGAALCEGITFENSTEDYAYRMFLFRKVGESL